MHGGRSGGGKAEHVDRMTGTSSDGEQEKGSRKKGRQCCLS